MGVGVDVHVPEERPVEDPVAAAEALFVPTAGIEGEGFALEDHVPRATTGLVRAVHLRVLSKLFQHHLGESGIARLINENPTLANVLAPTLAPLGWVELSDLVAALELAHERMPTQVVPRKVGRGTLSATFTHLFGADPTTLSAETVLAALPSFFDRYHTWGAVELEVHPGSAHISITGNSGSTDVCALVGAELERIVELTGANAVGAAHTSCAHAGGERCEFRLSWTTD